MRNPGTLRIPPERIYNGDYTLARNATIQKMLRMIGFGDNIGSGFSKIMKAWKSLGYPAPEIHEEPEVNEVWLTLPLPKELEHVRSDDTLNGALNAGETVNETVNSFSETQKLVLKEITKNRNITYKQLQNTLNLSRATVGRITSELKSLGLISRVGSDKTGHWVVNVDLEEDAL